MEKDDKKENGLEGVEEEMFCGFLKAVLPPPIVICNEDFSIKEGMKSVFEVGDLVVVKGITLKVAYVNGSSVTFERATAIIF